MKIIKNSIAVCCSSEIYGLISLLLISQLCLAQTSGTSFSRISDRTIKGEIASFNIAHEFEVPDTVLKREVNEIPFMNGTDSSIIFSTKGITVTISSIKFDPSKHKLSYDSQSYLELIDGKTFWGVDGGVPNEEIKSVNVTIGKVKFSLPMSAFEGIYQPNLWTKKNLTRELTLHSRVFRSTDKRRIYIYMNNGDGAGGYEVTWIIQDKKYLARVVDIGF